MKKARFDTLLIIRGLLALSVVVWHIGALNANTPAFLNIPGRTAVWMFFGISGYVISYGFITKRYHLNKADIKIFYLNRFLRIYPLFFLLSLLALVTGYLVEGEILLKVSDIPSQLLMLQFNHEYIYNGVFWTLGIEVQFYLVAPFLVFFFLKQYTKGWVFNASIYFLFVLWVPFSFYFLGWSFDGRNLISNLSHFFIGMIGCNMVLNNKYPKLNNYMLILLIIIIVLCTNQFYQSAIKYYWTLGTMLIDLAILLAIILHANLEKKIISKTGWILRMFTFLGVISYGVYAWHPYFIKYIPFLEDKTILLVVITVTTAYLSYQFLERPLLHLKKHKFKPGA